MKFTKKPVTIEAFQFQRRNNGTIPYPDWFDDAVTRNDIITHNTGKFHDPTQPAYCEIKTLEGVMRADQGDWIIRGIKGEMYPCKPDIFEATYSPASPAPVSVQEGQGGLTESTGNAEADRIIWRLMSSDPEFDDCEDAAKLIRELVQRQPWMPYLSDRADGCKGRYAIARWNPAGYREVWNLRTHKWAAFSDEVLSLEQAHNLLCHLTIPTAAPQEQAASRNRALLENHDPQNPQPHHCHKCGLPMIANPHPDAGKPGSYLQVGCPTECLPCTVKSRHEWSRRAAAVETELRELRASRAAVPEGWDAVPQAWNSLYVAVNHMMARLGAEGEIDARSTESSDVMDALHAIDGGVVNQRALELHEKAHMPLFNATNLALREVGQPSAAPATKPCTMRMSQGADVVEVTGRGDGKQDSGQAAKPLTRCAAARDGDCTHPQCPQLRDNEPRATGRHCPLDVKGGE